jgi:hypothetical protein
MFAVCDVFGKAGKNIRELFLMARMQFNLRHLLVAVVVAAVGLLLVRFAIQSHGVAVALVLVGIAAVIMLIANVALYAALRGFGLLFGLEPTETKSEPDENRG